MVYSPTQRNIARELEMVERHIIQVEMSTTAQRQRVENEEGRGEEASFSRSQLANFEKTLAAHYRHCNKILRGRGVLERN